MGPEKNEQGRRLSFQERLQRMSADELQKQLLETNKQLAELGVTTPVSDLMLGLEGFGDQIEDVRHADGTLKVTAMNLLVAVEYFQESAEDTYANRFGPEQRTRHKTNFRKKLATAAMTLDEFRRRNPGSSSWPEPLTHNPQDVNSQK